jgi:lipopolysaccharide transport system ATP-binding protein
MTSSSSVITARGLGKCYRVWTHAKPRTLSDRVEAMLHFTRSRAADAAPLREEIWALKDISFEVGRGEVLGVIGPNGAGKSTLLSILARITEPTEGMVEIAGRVCSILEVGTGFHQELSGRDNVFLNGAILGMSRAETAAKFDEIVEFSGVREFIDMPIKRYSSGMYVRLAFAVAAHLDPDVLLLDEVLAVGDQAFQEKSMRRIQEITDSGRTVLFVSHDVTKVAHLCERAIVVDNGRISFSGPVTEAIAAYLNATPLGGEAAPRSRHEGSGEIRLGRVRVDADGSPDVLVGDALSIHVDLRAIDPTVGAQLELGIHGSHDEHLVDLRADLEGLGVSTGASAVTCRLDELPLKPGLYRVSATIRRGGSLVDRAPRAAEFRILAGDLPGVDVSALETLSAPVLVPHRWETSETDRQEVTGVSPREAGA